LGLDFNKKVVAAGGTTYEPDLDARESESIPEKE